MTDSSIFNGGAPAPEVVPPTVPPVTSTIPPEVAEFVGEGKKYASLEEALKSVPHAQRLIPTLQEQLAEAKAELEKRRTTEDLLNELKQNGLPKAETPTVTGLTSEEVQKLVAQTLTQQQAQEKESSNVASVVASFTARFGEQAENEFKKIASESGLSIPELNRLSKVSPKVVLKLAGIEDKKVAPVVSKPNSSFNTEALKQSQSPEVLSARVNGTSTKALLNAWQIAGQKVGKNT